MPKNGKRIFGFCSKMLSPLVSPSYSNSSSTSEVASESMIDRSLQSTAEIINKWSTESRAYAEVSSIFHQSKEEALRFIRCVNELQKVMHHLTSEKLVFAHRLMKIAMKRLQVEFYRILSVEREPFDVESSPVRVRTAEDCDVRRISSVAMADLRAIADCMISSGHTKECVEIYTTIRKSVVDEGMYRLGIGKFSSQMIRKMNSEAVDFRIKKWLEGASTAITTIFNAERDLCDCVFATAESVKESCFTKICKDGAMLLFAFPEVIVKNQKSQKNLFCSLDMFTVIFENWSRIESIFSFQSTEVIQAQAIASLSVLSESISAVLSDYESSIQNDSSNSLSVDGGIHTLALQSMDCLSLLADYREILYLIFSRWPPPKKSPLLSDSCSSTSNSDDSPVSAVSSYMARIIFILLCKLDSKARLCDDISLSYFFLANNVRFVIWQVQSSKLHYLLGEEWIALHKAKVKQYIDSYERLAWGKVISTLPGNPTAALSTAEVAEVYDNFNSSFKEAYRKQRSSIVTDPKLRFEILTIAKSWLPVYREFYNAHRFPVGEEVESNLFPNQQNPHT
ncbi:exocyst complex component EXO70H1-like isoform X2 [Benincasa hispida]|uniref:exocyst complex component EXO70H1-like isoform X2 n=1 Tax=Benincasa hispida TaxID=102211 RepID=UPI0019023006|nr:exocyst complex component EXO70H1-like isoform X2 [Benincasa hispida]